MQKINGPYSRTLKILTLSLALTVLSLFYITPIEKIQAISPSAFGSESKWHYYFAPAGEIPLVGDFDGDNYKDDIVTFTSDADADVWVALGNGSNSFGTATKWHNYFAPHNEIPRVGDFNADGFDDIVTFTSDDLGDVWVALNNGGTGFNVASKWHDYFAPGDEIPLVGDFDHDTFDDIVTFTSDDLGDVYVALSNGINTFGTGQKWHDWFAPYDEVPVIGDISRDGIPDIVTFTQGASAKVYYAASNGSNAFGAGTQVNSLYFSPYDEIPMIGDFTGEGRDDLITFTNDSAADIWVATDNFVGPELFYDPTVWNDWFAPYNEIPAIGDFDHNGADDIITFTNDGNADVWVAVSTIVVP